MLPDDPRHGQRRGYYAHRKDGEEACDRCKRAAAAAEARYQWNRIRGVPASVPPHGTQRRLLALAALGWTWRAIAPYMDVDERVVYQFAREPRDYMHASTAEKVARVYDQLSMTRPEGPMAERMRRRAARRGWAPPLAWDDDTIDDPTAEPQGRAA